MDGATLIDLFNREFLATENTRLEAGGEEPVYVPADARPANHRIVFRHDYAASALHEIAHWCIAGSARRELPDYGYWYAPDGRDARAQHEFERLEARPQALEWIFSAACGLRFRPSIDNLGGTPANAEAFAGAIAHEAALLHANGLPPRADSFRAALERHTGLCASGPWTAARLLD